MVKCSECGSEDVTLLFTGYVCNVCDPVEEVHGPCYSRKCTMRSSSTHKVREIPYDLVKVYMENGWVFADAEQIQDVVDSLSLSCRYYDWACSSSTLFIMEHLVPTTVQVLFTEDVVETNVRCFPPSPEEKL